MTEIFVNNVKIDLTEGIPIPITYSVADITQPDKRNTAFSKTIVIPSSKTNDQLFGWIFEISKEALSTVNGVNFTPDFNPMLKADCKIFEDNILQFAGILQLLEIKLDSGIITYECVVFGSLKNIFSNLENYLLENLDMSEYDHDWTRVNMKNSWATEIVKNGGSYVNFSAGNPTGEGYVYPTIDYGFGQSMTYIQTKHTFPAIYVREYFVKMFAAGGYDWNSDFLDSNFFKRLIIPSNIFEDKLTSDQIDDRRFYAGHTSFGPLIYFIISESQRGKSTYLDFDDTSTPPYFDNYPSFYSGQTSSIFGTYSYWKVPESGYYDLKTTIGYKVQVLDNLGNPVLNIAYPITAQFIRESNNKTSVISSSLVSSTGTAQYNSNSTRTYKSSNVRLLKGDKIIVQVNWNAGNNIANTYSVYVYISSGTTSEFYNTPIAAPVQIGDALKLNSFIPKNVKCKDFFTSIIKMFNLYVQPDPNDENKLNIEPLIDFYSDTAIDWTNKIDYSKQVLIRPVSQIEAKQYEFKYKQDNDLYNLLYRETYGEGYGDRTVEILNDFVSQKKTTELIFSATPTVGTQVNTMAIPRICTQDTETLEIQPYAANIRILYYGGVKSAGGNWIWIDSDEFVHGSAAANTNAVCVNGNATITSISLVTYVAVGVGDIIRINGIIYTVASKASNQTITLNRPFESASGSYEWYYKLVATQKETTYAYAGHLDDPYSPTLDMLWNKPKEIFWGSPTDIGLGYTTNNLYNRYWSQFINEITDKDSKVVTYYVRLRPIDIFKLDFRKPIYISGVQYRLNKIIDYDPQNQETVKVELSKIKRYASFIPDTDEVISQNDPLNYDILEGGLDEVRSLTPISPIHLVECGIDQVIGTTGENIADLINGG